MLKATAKAGTEVAGHIFVVTNNLRKKPENRKIKGKILPQFYHKITFEILSIEPGNLVYYSEVEFQNFTPKTPKPYKYYKRVFLTENTAKKHAEKLNTPQNFL